jgi:hypothetical protein
MPRLTRTVLFLSALSLLILPMGNEASATDGPGTIKGTVVAGSAVSCAPQVNASHVRCTGGNLSSVEMDLTATRLVPDQNVAVCTGRADFIGLTTRETTLEGRGRVDDAHVFLRHPDGSHCRVRLSGRYHRIAVWVAGRLGIDVHRADGTFRHHYCATFDGMAVPDPLTGTTVVTATIEGIQNTDPNCGDAASPIDGRLPADGEDPEHHDTLVLP